MESTEEQSEFIQDDWHVAAYEVYDSYRDNEARARALHDYVMNRSALLGTMDATSVLVLGPGKRHSKN